jgi:hypothetical protein
MDKEQISEINAHIKAALKQWSDICLMSEADQWAFLLDYDSMDAMNVSYLFQHVCSNIGIKAGVINLNNVEDLGKRLRQLVIDMTGIDPHHVFDEMEQTPQSNCGIKNEDENGKEQETSPVGDGKLS